MSENQKNDQHGKITNTEPTKTQDLNKTHQNQQSESTKKTTNPEEGEEKNPREQPTKTQGSDQTHKKPIDKTENEHRTNHTPDSTGNHSR